MKGTLRGTHGVFMRVFIGDLKGDLEGDLGFGIIFTIDIILNPLCMCQE